MSNMKALIAASTATFALAAPAVAPAAPPKLVGTVGPGFTITLTMGGKKVTTLKAGTYTITVRDKSNLHNFHLRGKGVNKSSGVPKVGTTTWTVKLAKGKYTYICDPHASGMKGSFSVV